MIYVIIGIINVACFSTMAYQLGKYNERVGWNKLIAQGVIPAPDQK